MSLVSIKGLNAAKGEGHVVVPMGTYVANIGKVEVVPCKDPSKQMLKVMFRINDGSEHNGRPIFDQIVLPGAAMSETANEMSANRIKRLCIAAGISVEGDELDIMSLNGKMVKIEVGIRQYQGRDQNEVRDYLPTA